MSYTASVYPDFSNGCMIDISDYNSLDPSSRPCGCLSQGCGDCNGIPKNQYFMDINFTIKHHYNLLIFRDYWLIGVT